MNNQSISKLNFFLSGILPKLTDSSNFIKIDVEFTTGLKKIFLKCHLDDNSNLIYNYNGITTKTNFNSLFDFIKDEVKKYDKIKIFVVERTETLVIESIGKDIKYFIRENDNSDITKEIASSTILNRNYYIVASKAAPLLKEIGIMSSDGKILNDKIRKYNQIDHYVELIHGIIERLPSDTTINIVDCCCGKSYLTFVLNYYLTEVKKINCFFTGIDKSNSVIESSKSIAKNLNYRNMEFLSMNIENYTPKSTIHILISLHACDIATDYALYLGLNVRAKNIIAVPCCHREMSKNYSYNPFSDITKYNLLKNRMADVLTDGMRGLMLESFGYNVSIIEYVSPLETPKNLMMIATLNKYKLNDKKLNSYKKLMGNLNVTPTLYKLLFD